MEKFIDKISSYNILTNLLPGIIYCLILEQWVGIEICEGNTLESIFVYYFIGMIISRLGSVVVEPVLKKCKFIVYADEQQFRMAEVEDKKIASLLEINNTYRTIFTMFILIGVSKVIGKLYYVVSWSKIVLTILAYILLMILFAFSYRKQTGYIKNRVEGIKKECGKEKERNYGKK